MRVQSLGWEDPMEVGMATQSSILAWGISWTEEPGRLQSSGLQRDTSEARGMHTRRIQCQAAMSMKLIPGGSFPTLGTRNFNLIKPMAIVKERKSSVNPLLKLGEMQLPIPCFTS